MRFQEHVGVDYSGAGRPEEGLAGLRVFRATGGREAREVGVAPGSARRRWSRAALAAWLEERLRAPGPVVVGIDHCFSFPKAWLDARGLRDWDAFLARFCEEWPTDREPVSACWPAEGHAPPDERGRLRLCERWTSSAKSVFQRGMSGQVAASSHAGIPWLRRLRGALGARVFFWPYDGWSPPPGRHVVAEVYPSILRNRFPRRPGRTADQHDAYAVAEWLRTRDAAGLLDAYLAPPLGRAERRVARVEGWILGIM